MSNQDLEADIKDLKFALNESLQKQKQVLKHTHSLQTDFSDLQATHDFSLLELTSLREENLRLHDKWVKATAKSKLGERLISSRTNTIQADLNKAL